MKRAAALAAVLGCAAASATATARAAPTTQAATGPAAKARTRSATPASLYFDPGAGWAHTTMSDASTGSDYPDSATLGIGAGIPIVIVPRLRLAPYVAGLFHAPGEEPCSIPLSQTPTGSCPTRPEHSGFLGFGLEATVLLGR